MILKFYIDSVKINIDYLLNYQDGSEEIHSIIGDRLVSKLQNVYDELEILSRQLDFE